MDPVVVMKESTFACVDWVYTKNQLVYTHVTIEIFQNDTILGSITIATNENVSE